MNSVRPLVTITILVVVGAYLYVKINEGAVRPAPAGNTGWNQPPDGVPPLALAGEVPAATASAAPPWSAAATPESTVPPNAPAPVSTDAFAEVAATAAAPPVVPPIPEMPQMPTAAQTTAPPLDSIPLPTELPANIPTARYPDQPAVNGTSASNSVAASASPIASSAVGVGEIVSPPVTAPQQPLAPEGANAGSLASEAAAPPLATDVNPLRQPLEPIAGADRYGVASAPNPAGIDAGITPAETTFAASWPAIQVALQRGELASAHQLLSRWYDDPSLTPIDAEKVESLLSQLAGTVIYSTEHKLAPAHVVQPGETLESIAKQYDVPWQLLAKINGVSAADALRPGQELKVVRGPFSAIVDLARNRLTLMVDGRYAGRFSVTMPRDADPPIGEWVVQGKPAGAPAPASRQLLLTSAGASSAQPGQPLLIGPDARLETDLAQVGADGQVTKSSAPHLTVSPGDAEELADILSIGSRVVIQR